MAFMFDFSGSAGILSGSSALSHSVGHPDVGYNLSYKYSNRMVNTILATSKSMWLQTLCF